MALSNTATPIYYGRFREAVMRGEIPVCREIAMEMERIDDLIANPGIYYDDKAVNGFISFCEDELTLTDGTDVKLLDSFKLWAEEIFGWYYFVERSVFVPNERGGGGHYDEMIGKFTGNQTCACGFSIGFERIVMLLLERDYQIPGAQKKKAYLIEKNMPAEGMQKIIQQATKERSEGTAINIAVMKKNKKFQKEQLASEGYTEIEEFFVDKM